jgi:predicted O-methyltransferase YrrM
VLNERERAAIQRLWRRKVDQDRRGLPHSERHRNLHPDSAELIAALAVGLRAKKLLEIGGSSGISTIAMAVAARATEGKLLSLEVEPKRQREAQMTIRELWLADWVEFQLRDAAEILPHTEPRDFVLIDCEKDDYVRFFDMLPLESGAVVVADNVLSHDLTDYVNHVRSKPGVESITVPVGRGLEITRVRA